MAKSPQELYDERVKRVEDAVQLKTPDRVPLLLSTTFFPGRYGGLTFQEAMYDYDKIATAWQKHAIDFQPDMFTNPHQSIALVPLMDVLDFKPMQWPGHDLPACLFSSSKGNT